MKKWQKIGMTTALLFLFAGCGTSESEEATTDKDVVTLTYANWNLGTDAEKNLERLMIDAFNVAYPNIQVKIDQTIDGDDYTGKMNTAASAGKLPDVFMINDIPSNIKNEWLLDLSDLVADDAEFAAVDQIIQETLQVEDQVVAIPFAKHLLGYYVNTDLLDTLNLDAPTLDSHVEDFIDSIKQATDLGKGFVGVDSAHAIVDWYAGAQNEAMGWFTFQDGAFHLDANEMIEAVNTAKDLVTNQFSYINLPQEQKDALSGDDSGLAFKSGQIAYFYNGTYMNADLQANADFNFSFIGLPGGRQAITADYLGISQNTKDQEAAYTFAKYMSFGNEGFLKRISLAEEHGFELATLPLTNDSEVAEMYWAQVMVPGCEEANANLAQAMFEPTKVTPGYIQARFEASTGLKIGEEDNANVWYLLNAATAGEINYQDYAGQLQMLAQRQYEEANEAIFNE